MSNAIILRGSGGGGTVNGYSNVLRVQKDESIKKGDFITFDYYGETVAISNGKTSGVNIDGYYTAHLCQNKNTIVTAQIKNTSCFANRDRWRFDINSNTYYNSTIRRTCCPNYNGGDPETIDILLKVTAPDGNFDITITKDYWVGVPRLYKMSDTRFLLSYYAVRLAEVYCIEFVIFDIDKSKFRIVQKSNICQVVIANQHSTIPDSNWSEGTILHSYPVWYNGESEIAIIAKSAYDYGYTRSTERYDINIISDNSFYLWYGAYDGDIVDKKKHMCSDYSEKYMLSEGVLSCIDSKASTNSGLKSNTSDVFSHFDIGRFKHVTENVSLQQEYAGELGGVTYWHNYLYFGKDALTQSSEYPKVLISKKSTESGLWKTANALGDRIWSPMQFKIGVPAFNYSKKGASSLCYIEKHSNIHYVLSAHYGTFTNQSDNYKLCEDVLHITLTQYDEISKTSKIEIVAVPQTASDSYRDTTSDAGKITIKRVSGNLFLLVENAMSGTRDARVFFVRLSYNPNSVNDRWHLRTSSEAGVVLSATLKAYTYRGTYVRNITDDLLSSEDIVNFRTNESNILIADKVLTYTDEFKTNSSGAHTFRSFYYTYKIIIVDSTTGKTVEFLLAEKNAAPTVEPTGKHGYKETVVKPAGSNGVIMGVSLQNAKSLQAARIKEVYGNDSDADRYELHLGGVQYTEKNAPQTFKTAYAEARAQKLFGKALTEYIQNKCNF